MHSLGKHRFVWRAEFGHVWQFAVQDATGACIGRRLPMADVGALAAAWRDGHLFPVTTGDVGAWLSPDTPDRARGDLGEAAGAGPRQHRTGRASHAARAATGTHNSYELTDR